MVAADAWLEKIIPVKKTARTRIDTLDTENKRKPGFFEIILSPFAFAPLKSKF